MKRLIDADTLEKQFGVSDADLLALDEIRRAPTVDAEVVVRCNDCKHSWEDIGGLTCSHGVCVDCAVLADFYCAYGERKDGADAEG